MKYIVIGTLAALDRQVRTLMRALLDRRGRYGQVVSSAPVRTQHLCVARPVQRPSAADRYLSPFAVKDHSQHTIGVEFSSRTIRLGEKRIKLQVR